MLHHSGLRFSDATASASKIPPPSPVKLIRPFSWTSYESGPNRLPPSTPECLVVWCNDLGDYWLQADSDKKTVL
jgi:hypothetical protein